MRIRFGLPGPTSVFALSLLLAASTSAQLTPIGLSEVRAQWLEIPAAPPLDPRYVPSAMAAGDFNGDGADDLAIGSAYGANADGCVGTECGFVAIRYGAVGDGLVAPQFEILGEDLSASGAGEHYGAALVSDDFDDDGFDDLAIGIPFNSPGSRGGVRVHFGSGGGLLAGPTQFLSEATAGEPNHWCDNSHFGWALAAADFDGDGFADLAVGAPQGCDRILQGNSIRGGSVFVFHGGASGLLPFLGYRMSQSSFGIDPVEPGDGFGAALAGGDFDADSYADLAIGIPSEGSHGAVHLVMGSQFGLIFADCAFWLPGALGELPESGEQLGAFLASADFDGDGHYDLAVANPSESLPDPVNLQLFSGKADIAYGAPVFFDLDRTDRLTQGEIYGIAEQDGFIDQFGWSIAAADFDGDGFADLAVGHPFDSWSGELHGAVSVLSGSDGGVAASQRFRYLTSGFEGLPGYANETGQLVGSALAAGDFDGDGFADLAIGVPGHIGASPESGAVAVLYGALFADGFEVGWSGRWSATTR